MNETATPATGTHNVVATRRFDAPVERVWSAWIDSDEVKRWWGPQGFSCPVARMDVRVGQSSLICMRSPEGHDICTTWTYRAIEPPVRLEFTLAFADQEGNRLDPEAMGMPPGIPSDVLHVITLTEAPGGRTELTVTEYGYGSQMVADVSKSGLDEALDKLAGVVAAPDAQ